MDQMKTKFRLSRRIEEFYYEEESLDDNFSDNEYSVICNLIHQDALDKAKKLEIKNRVNDYLNQRPNYLNYTSDGDSLYSTSRSSPQISNPKSLSFNRKQFDLLENRINYFRPTEQHKQRQSDILPLDRYEQIIKDSPFESPISFENRRATVLPNFKTRAFEQSTQTSFNYDNNYENDNFKNDIHKSISKLSINNLIDKSTNTSNKTTNKSINNSSKSIRNSIKSSSSKINETNLNREFSNLKTDSRSHKISNSRINSTKNKSKFNYDKPHYITNAFIEEPDDVEDDLIKRRLAQTELIESLADDATLKSLKLNSLSNRNSTKHSSKSISTVGKTKNYVGSFNDPNTDIISKSTIATKSINNKISSRISFPLDTPIFDSELNEKSSSKSTQKSLSKNRSKLIQTSNSSKSNAKSLSTVDQSTKNRSKRKSKSLKVLRNSTNLNRKNSIKANDENQLRKSILKKSANKLIEDEKQNDLENVSLIFNSTKDSNNEEENLNLDDISVIGFENESRNESCDLEIVFDDEEENKETDQPVSLIKSNDLNIEINQKEVSQQKLTELSQLNDEIEIIRKSFNNQSVPETSFVQTSISETLSQPESMKKSLENEKVENNELTNKSKKQINTNLDFSIEFGESADEDDVKNKSIDNKLINKKLQILKSTPKSILKNNSKSSKRNWEVSDFSLVNLTINSAGKSISNNSSGQKVNSVRFSDKISEKFTNEILSSQRSNYDEIPLVSNKNEVEKSAVSKKDLTDNAKLVSDNLPDLNESYDNLNNLNEEKLSKISNEEENKSKEISLNESEESLNVTIDDLSLSLIEDENEEGTQTKSSSNKSSNKSTTNKSFMESLDSKDKTPINQMTNHQSTFTVKSLKKPVRPIKKQPTKNMNIKNLLPKYYETFVDKTPTIIYPELNEDNNEQENNHLVRRSNRIRVRPLDYWRNQKPKYKKDAKTKCLTIEGIDKGFVPDNPFKKKISRTNNPERNNQVKRKRSNKLKVLSKKRKISETLSTNEQVEEQKIEESKVVKIIKKIRYEPNDVSIHQELNKTAIQLSDQIKKEAAEFCSLNELQWTESKQSKGVFMSFMSRKKDKSGNTNATGFMKLTSLLKKPQQKSANYVTRYVVMFGCCSVIINDKPPVILKSMDSFVINKETYFSIENLRKDELLLYFSVSSS